MNIVLRRALQYVKNTNGGATRDDFISDNEPVGEWLWADLNAAGVVRIDDNEMIHVTPNGDLILKG